MRFDRSGSAFQVNLRNLWIFYVNCMQHGLTIKDKNTEKSPVRWKEQKIKCKDSYKDFKMFQFTLIHIVAGDTTDENKW